MQAGEVRAVVVVVVVVVVVECSNLHVSDGYGQSSQIKYFISETPVRVHETSVKEHLTNFTTVRHGNKHKMQMCTTGEVG